MFSLIFPLAFCFLCLLHFLLRSFLHWRTSDQDPSPMGDQKESSTRTSFTELGQVDKDFALARTLQDQEWAFMMLSVNEGDDEEHDNNDDDDNDDDDDDDDSEFLVDDESDDSEFLVAHEEEAGEGDYIEHIEEADDDDQDIEQDVDPDELSYEELNALGELVGMENRGLSTDGVASLPSFTYKHQPTLDNIFNRCVICQVDYEEGEELVVLPCKHPYHSECINKWLQINKVCPVCSTEVSSPSIGKTT